MKKLCLLFTIILSISFMPNAFGVEYGEEYKNQPSQNYTQKFKDVAKSYWAFSYIAEMNDRGVINGYPDGKYYPENSVTRAEFAKIMTCAAGMSVMNPTNQRFADVSTTEWYAPYIESAYPFLTGYTYNGSNYYKPDTPALREDIAIALVKLKGYSTLGADVSILKTMFSDYNSISSTAQAYVATAVERGLISGYDDGTFRGQATITRAEAATMLWRAYQYGDDNKVITDKDSLTETDTTIKENNEEKDNAKNSISETISNAETKEEQDVEEEIEEENVEPLKPYKIEKVAKANVDNAYTMASDDEDNIYYVDTEKNTIDKLNISDGDIETIVELDEISIDDDEKTCSDFAVKYLYYDTHDETLYATAEFRSVNSAVVDEFKGLFALYPTFEYLSNCNTRILASTADEWLTDGGKAWSDFGYSLDKIDKSDYTITELTGLEELDGAFTIEQHGGELYYIHNDSLQKYDYVEDTTVFDTASGYSHSKALKNGKVYFSYTKRAGECTIWIYNLKGKLLEEIDITDIEMKDGAGLYLYTESNAQTKEPKVRFFITSDEAIVFYDDTTKGFRKISKNS